MVSLFNLNFITLLIWLLLIITAISGWIACIIMLRAFFQQKIKLVLAEEKVKELNDLPAMSNIRRTDSSDYDIVTGLPNRNFFIKYLNTALLKAEEGKYRVTLVFIDLDNFKTVNDTFGPTVGDILLKQVGERILDKIGGKFSLVAHMGGDDYVVLLEKSSDSSKEISNIATNICAEIAKPFTIQGFEIRTSSSIGISQFPDTCSSAEQMIRQADTAKYSAKKLGRNTFSFYTKEMTENLIERSMLASDLRKAVENQELMLYYQPQFDANSLKIIGAEALIRWKHPKKGFIPPAIFIPLAEESGLIINMGNWIIKTACQNLYTLQQLGFHNLYIAVNLSAHQFSQGDIAGNIAEMLWETGLEPKSLEVELTESMVMGNPEKSLLMLRVLRSMGIHIAIDDFGTGYSSLSQLKLFPINTLKIDRSFVTNIHLDKNNIAIVSTIIAMAKKLNLRVIAEGVELKEELEILQKEGCDIIQGYLLAKPMPLDDFKVKLQNN